MTTTGRIMSMETTMDTPMVDTLGAMLAAHLRQALPTVRPFLL